MVAFAKLSELLDRARACAAYALIVAAAWIWPGDKCSGCDNLILEVLDKMGAHVPDRFVRACAFVAIWLDLVFGAWRRGADDVS